MLFTIDTSALSFGGTSVRKSYFLFLAVICHSARLHLLLNEQCFLLGSSRKLCSIVGMLFIYPVQLYQG